MSDSGSIIDIKNIELRNSRKIKKKDTDIDSEAPITICEWSGYNGRRCSKKSNGSSLCSKHSVLINDFKLIDSIKINNECCFYKQIKISPTSEKHVKNLMKKYNYDSVFLDVIFPGGHVEECNITNEDYIETEDETKYYYENNSNTKGKPKTKNIKLLFNKWCDKKPIVSFQGEEMYCKDCYKLASKKLGYPRISVLQNNNS